MTTDTIDLISNFVSIVIIADFDSMVFAAMKEEPLKQLLEPEFVEKTLIIRHTTSKKAKDHELADVLDENDDNRPLKVTFGRRSCCNKGERCCYAFSRWFYVVIYYYFFPFFGILLSILIPAIMKGL